MSLNVFECMCPRFKGLLGSMSTNPFYCENTRVPMLQHSIRAILIRATMEVLVLRRNKAISALVGLIMKEHPARVGGLYYVMSVGMS